PAPSPWSSTAGRSAWSGAVEAGQVVGWSSEPRYSYAGCAPLIEELAKAIEDAKKIV
ncbi:ABC transporter substrate-binding protein, partial [Streptomyces sp. NPDC048845]